MKFKANTASTRNSQASSQASAQASGQTSPSVPISVYRELAAELQATRVMVDSLNAKNQDLTLQNQKLRQEIHRFAQSAMALNSLVAPTQLPVHAAKATQQSPEVTNLHPSLEETAAASAIAARLRATEPTPSFDELLTGTQEPASASREKT